MRCVSWKDRLNRNGMMSRSGHLVFFFCCFTGILNKDRCFLAAIVSFMRYLHRQNRGPLRRSLSPRLRDLRGPHWTLLLPCLRRHTNERKPVWHTSDQTCDLVEPTLLQQKVRKEGADEFLFDGSESDIPLIAVVLESMHRARCTFARSPPGTTVGGW